MQIGPFQLTTAGITPIGRPPLAEWAGPLQFALWCQRSSPWWIGDLVNMGESCYGEEFSAVMGGTLSTEMVSRYASVARRVPPENRRASLSWSAHAAVARLGPVDQDRMLSRAVSEGWNSQELAVQVRKLYPREAK